MMNPPRAIKNADHKVSRVWEDEVTWEPHLSFGRRKSDNKDGAVGLTSVSENVCSKEIAEISPVAVRTAKCSPPKEVGFENPLDRKAVENKAVEGFASDFEFNKEPRIEGGSVGDSEIENMISDDAEIVARIQAMEDQDKLIWGVPKPIRFGHYSSHGGELDLVTVDHGSRSSRTTPISVIQTGRPLENYKHSGYLALVDWNK
ncbi:hypothetical protein Ancab_038019 [Ancistrocladus abbreviatus]